MLLDDGAEEQLPSAQRSSLYLLPSFSENE